jgi:hypothetical protein
MSDIKMRGPEDCAPTLSYAGETYGADKKGVFTVPVEAYGQLIGQGFTAVGDAPDEVQS